MEHNEYSVWKVKIRCRRKVREWVAQDESRVVGSKLCEEQYTMVAPKGDLGKALLQVHFAENTSWKYGVEETLDNGKKVEILEMVEEKLHTIIRFDDEYRGRM